MKSIIGHIVVFLFAAYLSLVGCGVSIQHFCCEECSHHYCHCHNHHHHTAACGFEFEQTGHFCGVMHIDGVLKNLPENHHFIFQVLESSVILCDNSITLEIESQDTNIQIEEHAPPIIRGRDILVRKSSYLI